jgi:hypothetical protein
VDQSAEETAWESIHDLFLPPGEHDRALMLTARATLWKENDPRPPGCLDDDASSATTIGIRNWPTAADGFDRFTAFVDDAWVAVIERDAQAPGSPVGSYATVA